MSKAITRAFRTAIRFASVSIAQIAQEAGYRPVTFDLYANRRGPSHSAALALADALDRRAQKLREHAERLRAAVGGADG